VGALAFVGIVAICVVALWWAWYSKKKRREELAQAAKQLGLQYSAEADPGLLRLPFGLFRRGDGRGVENMLWGTWNGTALREFDYWYYEETTDSEGHRSKSYYKFSCALTEIPAQSPHLTVTHEGFFSRLADHLGFHDIDFESEDFNRAFQVKCEDRKFANDVIDARMMQWLLAQDHHWSFELAGPYLLCYAKRLRPLELVPLLGTMRGFNDQIPRVVWSLYGTAQTG
jgi:hypothetical protein